MSYDDDDEEPGDDEPGDDDEPSLVTCPYCREPMLEDAPQCPACGNYVTDEERSDARKPSWIVLVVVGLLIVAFAWSAVL